MGFGCFLGIDACEDDLGVELRCRDEGAQLANSGSWCGQPSKYRTSIVCCCMGKTIGAGGRGARPWMAIMCPDVCV
jgi:hypothetical protein